MKNSAAAKIICDFGGANKKKSTDLTWHIQVDLSRLTKSTPRSDSMAMEKSSNNLLLRSKIMTNQTHADKQKIIEN